LITGNSAARHPGVAAELKYPPRFKLTLASSKGSPHRVSGSALLREMKMKIKFRVRNDGCLRVLIGDPRSRRKFMDADSQHRISGSNDQALPAENRQTTIDQERLFA
jgi:hypothetical protein